MSARQNIGLSAAAILLATSIAAPMIFKWEGDERVASPDPIGIPTACSGHTRGVVLGRRYSAEECRTLLVMDAAQHTAEIAHCIKVDVPPESLAAFGSFAFNVGAPKFCTSTMNRKLNAGDLLGACAGLSRWTYAGGRQLRGLVNRRAEERAMCERGAASLKARS